MSLVAMEIFVFTLFSCLQLLTGHEGPISALVFCPSRALLVSGAWDKTVRLWDVFEGKENTETLPFTSDGQWSFVLSVFCTEGGGRRAWELSPPEI